MMNENRFKETLETYNKAAKLYQDKYMELVLYNESYDKFCKLIEINNANILDIATGPGNITRYLNSKRPDFKILGIDYAPNMIELAKANNPESDFMVMDCRNIRFLNRTFDGVICGFCIPYLSKEDVNNLIKDISRILNSGAYLYLSTIEDDYNKSGFEYTSFSKDDRVYFYFYEAGFLKKCLKEHGFDIIHVQRQDFPGTAGTVATDLIIIAKRK